MSTTTAATPLSCSSRWRRTIARKQSMQHEFFDDEHLSATPGSSPTARGTRLAIRGVRPMSGRHCRR
ncbi:MAG TPA: hypothetical protein VGF99_11140 [Myxococcota bacterium]